MDPNSIIKLVRQQRRQINDSFNPNNTNTIDIILENTRSNPLEMSEHNQFIMPSNYSRSHPYMLDTQQQRVFEYTKSSQEFKFDKTDFKAHNELEEDTFQNNKKQKRNSFNNYEMIPSHLHYDQSRSASVKSAASDSGVGSSSPLSDCSDLCGSNCNTKTTFKPQNKIESKNKETTNQLINRKRKSDQGLYEEVFVNSYANNYPLKQLEQPNLVNQQQFTNGYNGYNSMQLQQAKQQQQIYKNNVQFQPNYTSSTSNPVMNQVHQLQQQRPNECTKECCSPKQFAPKPQPQPQHVLPTHFQLADRKQTGSIQHGLPVVHKPATCDCNECNYYYSKPLNQITKRICDCADPNCRFNYENEHEMNKNLMLMNQIKNEQQQNYFIQQQNQLYQKTVINPASREATCCLPQQPHLNPQQQQQQRMFCACNECLKMKPDPNRFNVFNKPTQDQILAQQMSNKTNDLVKRPSSFKPTSNQQTQSMHYLDEYSDLIKNGIQITKQKNRLYSENENDNIIVLNDQDKQMKVNKTLPKRPISQNDFNSIQINNSNISLITQAKRIHEKQFTKSPPQMTPVKNNDSPQQQSTSIVCLTVNNNPNDNDFELGEVVRIDKLKNTPNVEILQNSSLNEALKPISLEEVPVTLSKKMLPIVTPRIHDWLEKSVEFSTKMRLKTKLSQNSIFELLTRAWPRLLLVYMIENSFDFCVTKDNHQLATLSTNTIEKERSLTLISKLPKEKDANQLLNIINKGFHYNLNTQEYDLLREIVLFREGGQEPLFYKVFLDAQKQLQDTIESNHGKQQFSKLLLFLPNIYNIKTEIIDSLFCRNINNVYDLLKSRLK